MSEPGEREEAPELTGFGKPEDEARRILTYAKDWIGDANYRILHAEIVKSVAGLYSDLDRATKERDDLRLVIDVATDDDPGTALSKLHKIQYDAATRMRERCVARVKEMKADYDSKWREVAHPEKGGAITSQSWQHYSSAADDIITALESLTLEGEKEQ